MDGPSARHVGLCFIREYYQRLEKDPTKLRQLYNEAAEFTFAEGDEDITPVKGLEAIAAEIERIGFTNARIDLNAGSVDCQQSHDGGVMVMVCGLLTLSGQEPKQFVQSFFLGSSSTQQLRRAQQYTPSDWISTNRVGTCCPSCSACD